MNKLGWEELGKIVEWFYEVQQEGKQTFEVPVMRHVFNLTTADCYTRLKRFIKLKVIKRIGIGCYEITPLSPEKIEEIKSKYIPPNSVYRTYYFRGRWHTVEWIYRKCKPPMTLKYFAQRLDRGWTLERALETPIKH